MKPRDHDGLDEVAARILEGSYADEPPRGQRAAVLDLLCGPPPSPQDEALHTAGARVLEAAYATPASREQRSVVLDVIEERQPLHLSARAPREGVLALVSTLAAACVVVAVAVGLRDEAPPTWLQHAAAPSREEARPDLVRAHGLLQARTVVLPGVAVHGTPAARQAIANLRRACEAGEALSCRRVGTLYQSGRGVSASADEATGYFERACRAGDGRACQLRDAMRRRGLVDQLNKVDQDDIIDAEYFNTLGL
jgi:hypothetical protein